MGGAYSEGGAYWKEGAKSNHYGMLNEIKVNATCSSLYAAVGMSRNPSLH